MRENERKGVWGGKEEGKEESLWFIYHLTCFDHNIREGGKGREGPSEKKAWEGENRMREASRGGGNEKGIE